jgi:hypothetical protein
MFVSTLRRQGDLGEASALEWLVSKGAAIYVPFGHAPDFDLVAEMDHQLIRIQVKTSRCRNGNQVGGYHVQLSTRGGNQSWSGTSKLFDTKRCDYVFILVADGRRWLIPAAEIRAKHSLIVGGAAYRRFEVEPGRPFADESAAA